MREILSGDLPSPITPPSGCPFRTRCRYAIERCAAETPALRELDATLVACHRAEELAKMRASRRESPRSVPSLFRSKAVVIAAAAVSLAAALASQPSFAQSAAPPAPLTPIALAGDAARGAVLAETCAGCHGIPGSYNAYPAYHVPKLGGQNADYLEIALQGYRRGTRGHATMQAQASSLTDQDIADVAAYFASRRGRARGRAQQGHGARDRGRPRARRRPASQCHGPEGVAAARAVAESRGPARDRTCSRRSSQYKDGRRADLLMNPLIAPLDEATSRSSRRSSLRSRTCTTRRAERRAARKQS